MQQAGAALTVTGEAAFTTSSYAIALTNAGNNINEVSLNNYGESAVAVTTTGALLIDNSQIGNGALTISAGGAITETSYGGIVESLGNDAVAGVASFTAGADDPILLDNAGNEILGPINVTTSGAAGHVTIVNAASTILGADSTSGDFSVEVDRWRFDPTPGTSFTVGGAAFFSAADGSINLGNPGNTIAGTTQLDADYGATLAVTGAITLAESAVTAGPLNLTATGAINAVNAAIDADGGSFTSTAGSITLTNAANNFNDALVPSMLLPARSASPTAIQAACSLVQSRLAAAA